MEDKNQNFFDKAQLLSAMQTPQGQQLLRLLQSQRGADLQQAVQAAARGDSALAQELLRPVLESPEAEEFQQTMKGR